MAEAGVAVVEAGCRTAAGQAGAASAAGAAAGPAIGRVRRPRRRFVLAQRGAVDGGHTAGCSLQYGRWRRCFRANHAPPTGGLRGCREPRPGGINSLFEFLHLPDETLDLEEGSRSLIIIDFRTRSSSNTTTIRGWVEHVGAHTKHLSGASRRSTGRLMGSAAGMSLVGAYCLSLKGRT